MEQEIWIVLQIKNEQIGTEKVYSDEYNHYLNELRSYDDPYEGLGFSFGKPVEPKEKFKTVPYMKNIPRIIEVSFSNPTEKYKKRIAEGEQWHFNRELVWIEKIKINNKNEILEHLSLNFDRQKD